LLELFARREVVSVVLGAVVFAATVVGRGWPEVGACCAAAVAVRCVAVLAGEMSPVVATCVVAAAVDSMRVTFGTLGAAVALRVSVGVCVGLVVAVGALWPCVRVMREAT